MKIILNLLFTGVILGHGLLSLLVAYNLFRNRGQSRVFLTQSNLFLCLALFILLLVVTLSELPRPVPPKFTAYLYVTLVVLAVGVWPAAIDWLVLTRHKQKIAVESHKEDLS